MNEMNFIIEITKFDAGYILKPLMTSDKSLGSSGTESRVNENDCYFVTTYWTYWTLGIHMAKVDVPCVFKNPSGK